MELGTRWDKNSQVSDFKRVANKFVCATCIKDKTLRKTIKLKANNKNCSYCKRLSKSKNIAAPVNSIIELILDGLNYEWANPLNDISYITYEGGWQRRVYESWDLIDFISNEAGIANAALEKDIREALADKQWCIPSTPKWEDILSFSWRSFVENLTYKYRYTFLEVPDENFKSHYTKEFKDLSPKKFLQTLSRIINSHSKLISTIPINTEIFRVRWFNNQSEIKTSAKDLGTPPVKYATVTNRMSPPGIPIFYGALDEETVLRETVKDENAKHAIIAKFKTLAPLRILNLAELPPLPSLFDKQNRSLRDGIKFLEEFSNEVSRPIVRDGREHTEYVPTQVLSEYFRHIFKYKNKKIDGIYYKSSKNEKGICCALFIENEQCIDLPDKSTAFTLLQLNNFKYYTMA